MTKKIRYIYFCMPKFSELDIDHECNQVFGALSKNDSVSFSEWGGLMFGQFLATEHLI